MRFRPPGHSRSPESFRQVWREFGEDFDLMLDPQGAGGPLGQPLAWRGRTIGNRFAIHPMEGWDATETGLPTDLTRRRWQHFGASGAKLIWGGEAVAVRADGRANPNQLFLNPEVDSRAGLATLREELLARHRTDFGSVDDLVVGLQLTHSGRYARPRPGPPAPKIAVHRPVLDERLGLDANSPVLTDGELEGIGECYVELAGIAHELGFDFVDVKSCHGYLMHELLGAHSREGRYGGSFEGRTRLLRSIITEIQSACPGLGIGVRVSISDVVPFAADKESGIGHPVDVELPYRSGFGVNPDAPLTSDWGEPFALLAELEKLGVELINLSLGSPYYCPHVLRPAAYPPSDGYLPPHDPLVDVARHIDTARICKRAFPSLRFVGSGYTYLMEYLPHVAAAEVDAGHVDLVGIGRMVLSYPEFPRDVLAGQALDRRKLCRTFSDCTTGPRNHLRSGCYPLDPFYRDLPDAERLREVKRSAGRP